MLISIPWTAQGGLPHFARELRRLLELESFTEAAQTGNGKLGFKRRLCVSAIPPTEPYGRVTNVWCPSLSSWPGRNPRQDLPARGFLKAVRLPGPSSPEVSAPGHLWQAPVKSAGSPARDLSHEPGFRPTAVTWFNDRLQGSDLSH